MDRLKLSSTRVLGHGQSGASTTTSADDDQDSFTPRHRRHILVTGGFGSIGKQVVRDLLLSSRSTSKTGEDVWGAAGGSASGVMDELSWEKDALITILDTIDRTSELNFLLQSAPLDKPGRQRLKGTDPRTQAFSASERSVDSFRRMGKLRVVVGDVRDSDLVKELLSPTGNTVTELTAEQRAAALLNAKLGPLKQKGHQTKTVLIPPVTGIVHLASYNPQACRLNPVDCMSVEKDGMKAILAALEREGMEKLSGGKGEKAVVADRPWLVVPRRGDQWDEVRRLFAFSTLSCSRPVLAGGTINKFECNCTFDSRFRRARQNVHREIPSPFPPFATTIIQLHNRRPLLSSIRHSSQHRSISSRSSPDHDLPFDDAD